MTERLEFRVHGMDCADEVAVLRREIGPAVGGADGLSFDILRGKMTVATDGRAVGPDEIAAAVPKTGMRAELWTDVQPGAGERSFWQRRGRTCSRRSAASSRYSASRHTRQLRD